MVQQERVLESHWKCCDSADQMYCELLQQCLVSDLENTPGKVRLPSWGINCYKKSVNIEFSYKRRENKTCLCGGFFSHFCVLLCSYS